MTVEFAHASVVATAGVQEHTQQEEDIAAIPDKYLDLLERKKAFAALATTMPDGSPQVTPVWFDYKDGIIR